MEFVLNVNKELVATGDTAPASPACLMICEKVAAIKDIYEANTERRRLCLDRAEQAGHMNAAMLAEHTALSLEHLESKQKLLIADTAAMIGACAAGPETDCRSIL
jgi:hypothetical protein